MYCVTKNGPETFLWPFSSTFGLAYLPLNSAKLSCSGDVTLMYIILFQAAHVLIDRTGRAKLSGLRYSCSLYDSVVEASCSASVGCMTQDRYDYPLYVSLKHLNWMSPEILQQVYI